MEINRKTVRMCAMLGSRGTFGKAVYEVAKERDDFMVLSADLAGSSGLIRFTEEFADRFINVGIAEQNLIGIAAGIAREGIPVFATSFAPFITMRACEQLRMDASYMNLPIRVVGLGSGWSLGYLGNSHYGLEDVAVVRSMLNMTIVSPADGAEICKTVEAAIDYPGPLYIRLTGTVNNPVVYNLNYEFRIGKANVLREGKDVAIFAAGTMVAESLSAAKILEEHGISASVINMHTIKPLDQECIKNYSSCKLFVSVEEHITTGGLGSAILEYLNEMEIQKNVLKIGIPEKYVKAASYETLLKTYGLKEKDIAEYIIKKGWQQL